MLSHVAELNVQRDGCRVRFGVFSRYILEHGKAQQVTCVTMLMKLTRRDGRRQAAVFRRSVCTSDADLMLMMDVLEHIEDDHAFLADCAIAC